MQPNNIKGYIQIVEPVRMSLRERFSEHDTTFGESIYHAIYCYCLRSLNKWSKHILIIISDYGICVKPTESLKSCWAMAFCSILPDQDSTCTEAPETSLNWFHVICCDKEEMSQPSGQCLQPVWAYPLEQTRYWTFREEQSQKKKDFHRGTWNIFYLPSMWTEFDSGHPLSLTQLKI